MTRVEENKMLIEWARETCIDIAEHPSLSKMAVEIIDSIKATTLLDISASLAVIADSMTKEEEDE